MIALDTSVVIAAFATWHESHAIAAAALSDRPALPAPCALEVYVVLTRLPPPHRAAPALVRDLLAATFPAEPLAMPAAATSDLVETLVRHGVSGGASYDAVIGLVASHAGATLLTLDRRARLTYERIGATSRLLA